ncbi:MAG: hypothetical protein RIR77_1494 [Planctomycetota bacterium]|jgi:hypothetical protein
MTAPTATEGGQPFDRSQRAQLRRIGTVVGVLLVGAAVIAVWRNQAIGDSLARAVRHPDWIALVAIIIAIVANQVLTSGVFWILMRRHGSVGFQEMNLLVATSTLGNYVPMQAGSIGRMAYHRTVNGIPVRTSLVVILQAMSATAMATCAVGAVAVLAAGAGAPWWAATLVPVVWVPLAMDATWRPFAMVMVLRSVEVLVWAVHAWAAFRLSGWSIEPATAIGAALVASAANLVPFIGNGLGIREWSVALAAPLIGGYERDAGLAAELTGRAVDVVVAIPLGMIAFTALIKRTRTAFARVDR